MVPYTPPYMQWLTEIAKKYDRYLDLISCSSWIGRPIFRKKEEFIFWHFVIQITLMLLDAYFFFFHFQFLSVFGYAQFFYFLYTKNPLLLLTLINFIAFKTLISVINQKESFAITYLLHSNLLFLNWKTTISSLLYGLL